MLTNEVQFQKQLLFAQLAGLMMSYIGSKLYGDGYAAENERIVLEMAEGFLHQLAELDPIGVGGLYDAVIGDIKRNHNVP